MLLGTLAFGVSKALHALSQSSEKLYVVNTTVLLLIFFPNEETKV